MILKVVLFILIGISCYLIVDKLKEDDILKKINGYITEKNEKYYENLLKYYEKNKKIKLNLLLCVVLGVLAVATLLFMLIWGYFYPHICFFNRSSALFSSLDTCACEMPISFAISLCVLPI